MTAKLTDELIYKIEDVLSEFMDGSMTTIATRIVSLAHAFYSAQMEAEAVEFKYWTDLNGWIISNEDGTINYMEYGAVKMKEINQSELYQLFKQSKTNNL